MILSNLLETYSTNSLSWDELSYEEGKIKNVHYGLIHKGLPILSDISSIKLPCVLSELKNHTYIKTGDIILADASEDTKDIARSIEILNNKNEFVVGGLHTIHARPNKKFINGYLGYLLNSTAVHYQVRRLAVGTKVYSISSRDFKEINIAFPRLSEQQKIVDLLIAVDKKIETQNKIIEEFLNLKKVVVKQVILKVEAYESMDSLIKKGVLKLHRGNIIPKHPFDLMHIYPVYSSSINKDGLMGYSDSYMFDDEIITWSIDGGGNFFYRKPHKFSVTNVCGYLTLNKHLYNYLFLAEILIEQHSHLKFDYHSKAHPSVIEKLYKIPCIDLKVQNQLSIIFEKINRKNKLENDLLTKLKLVKKYLLKSLFI